MGEGGETSFWEEPWVEGGILSTKFHRLFTLVVGKRAMVAELAVY